MKLLAVLLTACIVFVSFFPATVSPPVKKGEDPCCFMQAMEMKHEKNACSESGCRQMFSCHLCMLIAIAPETLRPSFAEPPSKPAGHYEAGYSPVEGPRAWKPPRT